MGKRMRKETYQLETQEPEVVAQPPEPEEPETEPPEHENLPAKSSTELMGTQPPALTADELTEVKARIDRLTEAVRELTGSADDVAEVSAVAAQAQELAAGVALLSKSMQDAAEAQDAFWHNVNRTAPALITACRFVLLVLITLFCFGAYSLDAAATDGTTLAETRTEQVYQQMTVAWNKQHPGQQMTYVEFRSQHDPKFAAAYETAARKVATGMHGMSGAEAQELVTAMLAQERGRQ